MLICRESDLQKNEEQDPKGKADKKPFPGVGQLLITTATMDLQPTTNQPRLLEIYADGWS
ncbi:hypothetical protein [Synechococcus sp. ROS8604]|uniref:hypothetical protein n=1 Tax=Synechococcus sp. ROS8604 TaxID=1442557 RepID=UPI001647054B|nr:hypothetical protein [Synechococcus sp. ROS8604]